MAQAKVVHTFVVVLLSTPEQHQVKIEEFINEATKFQPKIPHKVIGQTIPSARAAEALHCKSSEDMMSVYMGLHSLKIMCAMHT